MPFGRNRAAYSPRWSYGCVAVFILPFVAVGFGMSGCAGWMVAQKHAVQSWVETRATITKADLDVSHGDDGDSYTAIANYEYDFGGRHYKGNRVTISSNSTSDGFQQRAYHELKQRLDQKRPFRCYVNPADPSQSILYRELSWQSLAFMTLFGTTFGSIGIAVLIGALIAGHQEHKNRVADPPLDQPWLGRNDWASGRIASSAAGLLGVIVLPVVALYWFAASTPLMTQYPVIFDAANQTPWKWLTLAFPAVGVFLVAAFLRVRARWRNFGDSVFDMASVPGVVGGQLAGVIRIPRLLNQWEAFRLKLLCIEKRKSKNSEAEDKVLWHDERIVDRPMQNSFTEETAVPVLFAVPFEADATTSPIADRVIEWRLEASSAQGGVDYREQFEVPVFKTPDSRPDFQLDETLAAEFGPPPEPDAILREDGIVREELPDGGVRLSFPAWRNWKSAFKLALFAIAWSVFVWIAFNAPGIPSIFPILFGGVEVILLWVIIHMLVVSSAVEASRDGITVQNSWLGIGRRRSYAADEIASLTPAKFVSSGTIVWTRIQLLTTAGKKRTITKPLRGKLIERTVLEELNAALARNTEPSAASAANNDGRESDAATAD